MSQRKEPARQQLILLIEAIRVCKNLKEVEAVRNQYFELYANRKESKYCHIKPFISRVLDHLIVNPEAKLFTSGYDLQVQMGATSVRAILRKLAAH